MPKEIVETVTEQVVDTVLTISTDNLRKIFIFVVAANIVGNLITYRIQDRRNRR